MGTNLITANFKGQDKSCGFQNLKNFKYTLKITHNYREYIHVEDVNNSENHCDYESMNAFLNNWDNISNLK